MSTNVIASDHRSAIPNAAPRNVNNVYSSMLNPKEGCGIINDNAEKFVNFCLNNNCVIGGTTFQHKEIHELSWKSPDG